MESVLLIHNDIQKKFNKVSPCSRTTRFIKEDPSCVLSACTPALPSVLDPVPFHLEKRIPLPYSFPRNWNWHLNAKFILCVNMLKQLLFIWSPERIAFWGSHQVAFLELWTCQKTLLRKTIHKNFYFFFSKVLLILKEKE